MITSGSKKQKSIQQHEKHPCFIIGPRKLQNELIAAHIKREIGNECVILADIDGIPIDIPEDPGRPKLIFIDCHDNDPKSLLADLKTHRRRKQSLKRIILFNVPTGMECKKKFVLRGIHGFFYEYDPLDVFMKGVRTVIDGKLWLSRDMMTQCIFEGRDRDKSSKNGNLTERQTEVLALVAVGANNDEIADRLCISPYTVKTHLYNIFKKISVPNRVQASLWAAKNL